MNSESIEKLVLTLRKSQIRDLEYHMDKSEMVICFQDSMGNAAHALHARRIVYVGLSTTIDGDEAPWFVAGIRLNMKGMAKVLS